eukprot:RCo015581
MTSERVNFDHFDHFVFFGRIVLPTLPTAEPVVREHQRMPHIYNTLAKKFALEDIFAEDRRWPPQPVPEWAAFRTPLSAPDSFLLRWLRFQPSTFPPAKASKRIFSRFLLPCHPKHYLFWPC